MTNKPDPTNTQPRGTVTVTFTACPGGTVYPFELTDNEVDTIAKVIAQTVEYYFIGKPDRANMRQFLAGKQPFVIDVGVF